MGIATFLIALIAILILFILIKGIHIVKQSTVMIVERLGKYHKTLHTGVNLIIPFLDKIRIIPKRISRTDGNGRSYIQYIRTDVIDMRECVYDFPKQTVITKDNVTIEINAILYYQITDPFKSTYEIEDLSLAIEKLTQTTLRNIIGELELDQTLTSRDTINGKLREILDEATDKWGVKVNRVELQDIVPPKDIRDAMEKQMRAERERREMILKAEGEKSAKILQAEGERDKLIAEAEGEKQSQVLRAKGEAEAKLAIANAEAESLRMLNEALTSSSVNPAQYMVALKYVEAMKEIASQDGEKVVFMPYEASALMSSVSSIKELFNK
ncbi:MAG: SPFH/Band 7/PHB domain protein [Spirochaetales bacterium]|nr:SPFH/Band 7/PHB domain protein [Spirochaetales bacterium]